MFQEHVQQFLRRLVLLTLNWVISSADHWRGGTLPPELYTITDPGWGFAPSVRKGSISMISKNMFHPTTHPLAAAQLATACGELQMPSSSDFGVSDLPGVVVVCTTASDRVCSEFLRLPVFNRNTEFLFIILCAWTAPKTSVSLSSFTPLCCHLLQPARCHL